MGRGVFGYHSNTDWFQCTFLWDDKTLQFRDGSTEPDDSTETTDTAGRGVTRRIRVYYSGERDFACTLENETQGVVGTLTTTISDVNTSSHKGGLRVFRETAAFESFVLYE